MSFQRRAGGLLLALFALLAAGASAREAGADELYVVRGVEVELTAADAAQAREAGLALGQSRALQRLWARLVPEAMLSRAPSLSTQQIAGLIEDFGVAEESSGENSYRGRLTVRFRPAEVRRVLRDAGVPYAEQRGRPLLLLPLFADQAGTRLWDEPNPWQRAWRRRDEVGLVPLIVPLGDLADFSAIDARRAEALDREALDAIAEVHGTAEVLVTIARLSGDPQRGEAGLSIELRHIGPGRDGGLEMESLRQREGEPAERFYDRATAAVDRRLQEEWKRTNLLRFDSRERLVVQVPIRGLQDWLQVRRGLDATAAVVEQEIVHLTRERAIVALSFVGAPEQLADALARHSLALERLAEATPGLPAWRLAPGLDPRAPPAVPERTEESGTRPVPTGPRTGEGSAGTGERPGLRLPLGVQ